MQIGDVVTTKAFTENVSKPRNAPGLTAARSSAPRGRHLVFLVLGTEPADGSEPLDADAVLNRMGWFRRSEIEAAEAVDRG